MQIIRDIATLRAAIAELRKDGGTVALIPTMGALHAGHMTLVAEGKRRADHVVASIFVNPTQFGPNEDLDKYPRREAQDATMLREAGCEILWAPSVETMYPQGFSTFIHVSGVTDILDGAARPGHFDGVATVVTKLLNQVSPDIALFGEKDYQQLVVIQRLVQDLNIPAEIVGVLTQRDADGLALSSRNAYLSPEARRVARALPRILGEAAHAIRLGGDVAEILNTTRSSLMAAGFDHVDYVEVCDGETLQQVSTLARPTRLLAAVKIGQTRLIDNLALL